MCRRRRGHAQSLYRQYKKSVGGQRGVRACSCHTAKYVSAKLLPAPGYCYCPGTTCPAFPACVKGGFEPAATPPSIFPCLLCWLNRGSFGEARGHAENSPCLPHPQCGKEWCFEGWSSRMPLPTLLLSPWELSGPQRPKNTFLFS